tara:strand:+ start:362 stop:547 length:186 start_codon:yes stop_codon:yes gene_type:complete
MDEQLKTIADTAGLDTVLKERPELIEAAWKRARVYARRLPALALTDEPAHIFTASTLDSSK